MSEEILEKIEECRDTLSTVNETMDIFGDLARRGINPTEIQMVKHTMCMLAVQLNWQLNSVHNAIRTKSTFLPAECGNICAELVKIYTIIRNIYEQIDKHMSATINENAVKNLKEQIINSIEYIKNHKMADPLITPVVQKDSDIPLTFMNYFLKEWQGQYEPKTPAQDPKNVGQPIAKVLFDLMATGANNKDPQARQKIAPIEQAAGKLIQFIFEQKDVKKEEPVEEKKVDAEQQKKEQTAKIMNSLCGMLNCIKEGEVDSNGIIDNMEKMDDNWGPTIANAWRALYAQK